MPTGVEYLSLDTCDCQGILGHCGSDCLVLLTFQCPTDDPEFFAEIERETGVDYTPKEAPDA